MYNIPPEFMFSPENAILVILAIIFLFITMILAIFIIPIIGNKIKSFYDKNKNYKIYTTIILLIFILLFHKQMNDLVYNNGIIGFLALFSIYALGMTIFFFIFQIFLFDIVGNPLIRFSVEPSSLFNTFELKTYRTKLNKNNNSIECFSKENSTYDDWLNTLQGNNI